MAAHRTRLSPRALFLVTGLGLLGCGPVDLDPADSRRDEGDTQSKGKQGDVSSERCSHSSFEVDERTTQIVPQIDLLWLGLRRGDDPYDFLEIALAGYAGGLTEVGSVTIQGEDTRPSNCVNCVTISTGCSGTGGPCEHNYIAWAGTLEISVISSATFNGSFSGELVEYQDPNLLAVPIEGLEIWCLDNYRF